MESSCGKWRRSSTQSSGIDDASATRLHCPRRTCCTPSVGGCMPIEAARKPSGLCRCSSTVLDPRECHGPTALATTTDGSIGGFASEPFDSTLSSRAVRLLEQLLRPSSLANAQPQQAFLGAEQQGPAPEDGTQPSALSAEALYIFSPYHEGKACYLYRSETAGSRDVYGFEHVAVRAVRGCGGQPAYVMTMSDRDAAGDSLRPGCTFADRGAAVSSAKASSTVPTPRDGRDEAGSDPVEEEAPSSEPRPQSSSASMVKKVTANMRRQLQNATRHSVLFSHGAKEGNENNGTIYLVRDKDMVDFVSLALAELEQADGTESPKTVNAHGGRASSASSAAPSRPRLNSRSNLITPSLASTAAPATTTDVAKTSFSSSADADRGCCGGTKCPGMSTSATAVSRRSATEVAWREVEAEGGLHGTKRTWRTEPAAMCKEPSCSLRVESPAKSHARNSVSTGGSSARGSHAPLQVNMTSFPELQSRHCTKEWLKPPMDLDQLTEAPPSDFYGLGVDAHGGGDAMGHNMSRSVVNGLYLDDSLFGENPFDGQGHDFTRERQSTRRSSSMAGDKRLGAWIGSASHRRRSTPADTKSCRDGPANSQGSSVPLPNLLGRVLERGQSIFHRQDDGPTPAATTTPGSCRSEAGSEAGKRAPRRSRCDTCFEDNRPHVCENEAESVSSTG